MSEDKTKVSGLLKIVLIISSLISIVLFKAGFIFILIAFLPAFVAFFIDETVEKSNFKIIMLCNFAAALPSLTPMIFAAALMQPFNIMDTMMSPVVWLVIYAGAASGWGLIFLCKFIARLFVIIYFGYQEKYFERFQKRLVGEWGDKIRGEEKEDSK